MTMHEDDVGGDEEDEDGGGLARCLLILEIDYLWCCRFVCQKQLQFKIRIETYL